MLFVSKSFEELSTHELYEIMCARAKIFVGEKKILYVDADGLDYDCVHVFNMTSDKNIGAYLRMYRADG